MKFQFLVICATLCDVWTTFVTVFSKVMSISMITMFEIGNAMILIPFQITSIFGHLYHILCHFDQFGDKIGKNQAHIRNQHV